MVAEGFTLVRAHGLRRIGDGGGNEHEEIEVHLVPRADIPAFVAQKRAEGCRDRREDADLLTRRRASLSSTFTFIDPDCRLSKLLRARFRPQAARAAANFRSGRGLS